jgi:AraC-like DNA-binding protein
MQYLTDWRMTLARDLLLTDHATLNQIAARAGCASLYAFAATTVTHPGAGASTRARRKNPIATPTAEPAPSVDVSR